MARLGWVLGIAGAGLLTIGCGGDSEGSTSGTGGNGIGGSGGGGTGGAEPSGGAPTAGGSPTGGTAAGGSAVGGSGGTGGALGAPPAECIAPCLWSLIAPCRPTNGCVYEGGDELDSVACDPNSGWRREALSDVAWNITGPDGAFCYTITTEGSLTLYRDATGALVATLDPTGMANLDSPYETRCEDGSPPIMTRHTDPVCEPWLAPECTPGDCP